MQVVLGLDGSDHATVARDLVAGLPWPAGTIVHVVAAYQLPRDDALQLNVAAVHAEMERSGRDPAELVVSMLAATVSTDGPQQLIDALGDYARAGLHHLVGVPWVTPVSLAALSTHDRLRVTLVNLEQFAADVLPALR